MDEELYKENLLDHNKNPHNKRVIAGLPAASPAHANSAGGDTAQAGALFEAEVRNVSCGDRGILFVFFDADGRVSDSAFQGEGCAVSQAGLSMLTDKLRGMTKGELKLLSPGDIYTMLGVTISPSRVKCALLGYEALQKLLKQNQGPTLGSGVHEGQTLKLCTH